MDTVETTNTTTNAEQRFSLKAGDAELDKRLFITGPLTALTLIVDNDDVDRYTSAHELRKIFQILGDHWNDPAYPDTALPPPADVDDDEDDAVWEAREEANDKAWHDRYQDGIALLASLMESEISVG